MVVCCVLCVVCALCVCALSFDNWYSFAADMRRKIQSKPRVVQKEDILEHSSLMEDLKWDINTATDEERLSSGRLRHNFDKSEDPWGKMAHEMGDKAAPGASGKEGKEAATAEGRFGGGGAATAAGGKSALTAHDDAEALRERRQRSSRLEHLGKPTDRPLPVRDWSKPGKWAYKPEDALRSTAALKP